MSKNLSVVDCEIYLNQDEIVLFISDGTELNYPSEDFQDWLQEKEDLTDYEFEGGEFFDDGEGFTTSVKSIDWQSVYERFANVETAQRFYRSLPNTIIK